MEWIRVGLPQCIIKIAPVSGQRRVKKQTKMNKKSQISEERPNVCTAYARLKVHH